MACYFEVHYPDGQPPVLAIGTGAMESVLRRSSEVWLVVGILDDAPNIDRRDPVRGLQERRLARCNEDVYGALYDTAEELRLDSVGRFDEVVNSVCARFKEASITTYGQNGFSKEDACILVNKTCHSVAVVPASQAAGIVARYGFVLG